MNEKKESKKDKVSKEETKKELPNIMDMKKNCYVMDPANVLLFAKAPSFIDSDGFECKEFGRMELIDWSKAQTDINRERIYMPNKTIVGYELVVQFLGVVKALTGNKKVSMESIAVYESVKGCNPIVMTYRDIMGILAPRVDE